MGGSERFWRWKSGKVEGKLEKLSFFQRNLGQLFQFCHGRIEASLLHIRNSNYPSIYLKCPRKYQKTYNFDIFTTLPKICTSPPPKFWERNLNLIIPPCVYYCV